MPRPPDPVVRGRPTIVPARLASVRAPVLVLVATLALSGCAGTPVGARTTPSPQPSGPTAASSTPSGAASSAPIRIPSDGSTLASLGYTNGPRLTFSVPAASYVSASSDQSSLVTVVLASPAPSTVYDYLVSALPAAGYTVTAHSGPSGGAGPALSFTGHGWTGQFTGAGSTSAVTLRPAG